MSDQEEERGSAMEEGILLMEETVIQALEAFWEGHFKHCEGEAFTDDEVDAMSVAALCRATASAAGGRDLTRDQWLDYAGKMFDQMDFDDSEALVNTTEVGKS